MIAKAPDSDVAIFYHRYFQKIPEGDVLTRLEQQAAEIRNLLSKLSPEEQNFAYAPGKWTVKELFGHLVDTERIMAFRTPCLARGEKQSLPGFDEKEYVANAHFPHRPLESLLQEYNHQRQSNLTLFKSFDEATLRRTGLANNSRATVQGIITIIAAHEFHHLQILKERYHLG